MRADCTERGVSEVLERKSEGKYTYVSHLLAMKTTKLWRQKGESENMKRRMQGGH